MKPGNLQNIFLSCALGFEFYESNSKVKMANPKLNEQSGYRLLR